MLLRNLAVAVLCLASCLAQAQEFRAINPIRSPRVQLPAGAQRVTPQKPVPREKIEAAVAKIMAAWNTPTLEKFLSKDFYDKNRLLDNLGSKAPRDATLRVIGIQGIQVLDQFIVPPTATIPFKVMVTQVSVTVHTQVEYNDAAGFQRLDGTNDYIIEIPEPAP